MKPKIKLLTFRQRKIRALQKALDYWAEGEDKLRNNYFELQLFHSFMQSSVAAIISTIDPAKDKNRSVLSDLKFVKSKDSTLTYESKTELPEFKITIKD